jgi:hypothetical protein
MYNTNTEPTILLDLRRLLLSILNFNVTWGGHKVGGWAQNRGLTLI